MFRNRQQAGSALAKCIVEMQVSEDGLNPATTIVIALPRGGVPVALEIALTLGCPLDVLVSKKIGAPDQSELAIGAVSSEGIVVLNQEIMKYCQVPQVPNDYIENQRQCLIDRTRALQVHWRHSAGLEEYLNVQGKQVIAVDDGIATGMTAIAALRSFRKMACRTLILAVPVISASAYELINEECDQIVELIAPAEFSAVGQFYSDFHQVEDEEVIEALKIADRQNSVSKNLALS